MKKLFQGIKTDVKFKSAGPGHKLNEEKRENLPNVPKETAKPRKPPTGEAQVAAATAAMARIEGKSRVLPKDPIKTQVKRELEAAQVEAIIDKKSVTSTAMESISVCNVRFRCPLTGDIIQKEEREEHIRKAIQMLAITNPTSASIMKIHTFNKDRERVKNGTETISKYFDNIISNPDEEKYRKIKLSNKVFQERISSLEGANEFLEAVGFEKKMLPVPGQEVQEEFYMLSNIATETLDTLQKQRDVLLSAEPLKATLERQPRVFTPSIQAAHFNLPDDFYNLTADEIKREQRLSYNSSIHCPKCIRSRLISEVKQGQAWTEALDRSSMLRTKAMREKEEQREMRKYNYTVMRVRLPDGYILQGMFYAREKVSALSDFVRDQLQTDWLPFELLAPGGHKLEDEHVAFNECGLVPSALLTFRWDAAVLADVEAAGGQEIKSVLKPELLAKAETLS